MIPGHLRRQSAPALRLTCPGPDADGGVPLESSFAVNLSTRNSRQSSRDKTAFPAHGEGPTSQISEPAGGGSLSISPSLREPSESPLPAGQSTIPVENHRHASPNHRQPYDHSGGAPLPSDIWLRRPESPDVTSSGSATPTAHSLPSPVPWSSPTPLDGLDPVTDEIDLALMDCDEREFGNATRGRESRIAHFSSADRGFHPSESTPTDPRSCPGSNWGTTSNPSSSSSFPTTPSQSFHASSPITQGDQSESSETHVVDSSEKRLSTCPELHNHEIGTEDESEGGIEFNMEMEECDGRMSRSGGATSDPTRHPVFTGDWLGASQASTQGPGPDESVEVQSLGAGHGLTGQELLERSGVTTPSGHVPSIATLPESSSASDLSSAETTEECDLSPWEQLPFEVDAEDEEEISAIFMSGSTDIGMNSSLFDASAPFLTSEPPANASGNDSAASAIEISPAVSSDDSGPSSPAPGSEYSPPQSPESFFAQIPVFEAVVVNAIGSFMTEEGAMAIPFVGITNEVASELAFQEYERYNSDFAGFCASLWNHQVLYQRAPNGPPPPRVSMEAKRIKDWALTRPKEIMREDMESGNDVQGIEWEKLQITRKQARSIRRSRYSNYRNVGGFQEDLVPIRSSKHYYSFNRLATDQPCRLMHFQLRNVLCMTSRNDIFYSTGLSVVAHHPVTHNTATLMNLSETSGLSDPIRVSTLGACPGRDAVLIAGGFFGNYAMRVLNAPPSNPMSVGTITDHDTSITNHIQLITPRSSSIPQAVFSSNDAFIRVMDTSSTKFVSAHPFDWPINCSATSPDSRLRAVVGDTEETLITDSIRGTTEFVLRGHQDYGFAVAWSPDGYTIATGNQDQTVRIYDARNFNRPLKIIPTVMAGCRTLRFSPDGSILAVAEPADYIHFLEKTSSWESAQSVEFWGEVGGMEFSPDGGEFIVANCDRSVGGIMTFTRNAAARWKTTVPKRSREWDVDEESEDEWKGRRWKRMGTHGVFV